MWKLVSVAEMQAIEKEANANGLTYEQMMENAGRGLAEEVDITHSHLSNKQIMGLVGSGNNGGDTLVALSRLAELGWNTNAYIVRPRPEKDPLIDRLEQHGGTVIHKVDDDGFGRLTQLLESHEVLLDGVLGTGIKLPIIGELGECLRYIKAFIKSKRGGFHVIAVDCPSGVDCDTGEAGEEVIPAEMTVTMAAVKKGLLQFPAYNSVGELRVVKIGDLDRITSWNHIRRSVVTIEDVKRILPPRPADSHKGTFGTVLIVAGSMNYTGAALLAGEAAYRVGAGLVTMAVPEPLHAVLAGQLPEATWLLLPHDLGVISSGASQLVRHFFGRANAVLIGPGLGLELTTKKFLADLFNYRPRSFDLPGIFHAESGRTETEQNINVPPLVIDADGLKLLSRISDWSKAIPALSVLTPHPGEMSVLTGLSRDEIQSDRLGVAEHYAKNWGHVMVLKGAFTVVASPDGRTSVIPVATSALARAGTGDVLAGLIVGLRGQGVEAFDAAAAGAWIHAQAGLRAAEILENTASVLAREVIRASVEVISSVSGFVENQK